MFRPRIIPVLLLHNNGLVKTKRFDNPVYVGDPLNAVKIFNDLEADELIFLDIDASPSQKTISLEVVKQIGEEAFMPISVGGGIRTLNQVENIIHMGAEKVIINTAFFKDPRLVKEASDILGSQSVVVSLDAILKDDGSYEVLISGGKVATGIKPDQAAKMAEDYGAGEIMINSIDRDGCRCGYDLNLIKQVSDAVGVPVIACGGANDEDDFVAAFENGHASAVAAGSLFVFIGKKQAVMINYPDREEIRDIFDS